ncbi:MAG: thrombospondin type 3 repeat-containing protein [Porticoccaceae bacterium]
MQSVQSLAATDIDGDQLIWSIEGGVDSGLFSINARGELKFITAPDYENPTDTNIDNIYQVSINVSDGRAADSELLSIEVLDRLEGRVGGDPLVGARVFLDINTNAKLDANEPQAITSDSGHFIFTQQSPADINAKQIISLGGANKNTGVSIAHLGLVSELPQEGGAATMVTPLTTVLSQITFAPERGAFVQMMGLSQNTTQIYTANPWEGSLLGDAGAQDTQRLNGQLSLLILSLDVLFESEDPIDPLLFSEVFTQQLIANLATGRASLSQAAAIKNMLYQSHNKLLQEQDFSNQLDAQIFELIAQAVAAVSEIFASPAINPASDFSIALRRAAEAELRRLIKALIKGQISPQSFVQQSAIEVLFGHIQAEGFPDTDGDGLVDILDDDSDNDGVLDTFDAFPTVFSESLDTDTDGIGNNADTDDDGDGVPDSQDAFPFNPAESLDTDGDGLGNNTDTDDDGDGVDDQADRFPLNGDETIDTDNDGIGNNADTDDDGDDVADTADMFPLDANEALDTDQDGLGNNADTDDDGDQIADADDRFPLDASEFIDTDADGLGNNSDPDDDNDGVADVTDQFPLDATETIDTDYDGIGNNADTDDDGDGIADSTDAFPLNSTESVDTDGDGIGNNADLDDDADGTGNNSDSDDDNDGVADSTDAFPLDASETLDTDADGTGNNADTDDDGDGTEDSADDFPLDASETVDTDSDGIGNNADSDDDGDGVADSTDAFPLDSSESLDTDGDGIGNNTDTDDDGDGVTDSEDTYPLDASRSAEDKFDTDSWANTVWGAESEEGVSIWNTDLWGAKEWK